ncbi:hypothetical protein FA15DRAFT_603975 [Coprinopsis marcescibilis]|uniref:Uncharacterized protein n=1 Tax=Coprinopsis marcescibilis TaxID=230819 RepID=A0A5C3KEE8_COPMA|nr:hypothetical protein FA15DRAFT_603975 [Coprinopsis marcescibilis]
MTVVIMYLKSRGKNGNHSAITDTLAISAVSYLSIQIYKHSMAGLFNSITDITVILNTFQFSHLHSIHLLMVLLASAVVIQGQGNVTLSWEFSRIFASLQREVPQLGLSVKAFNAWSK